MDLHNTIEMVKEKFRKHIGTPIEYQKLILKEHGHQICEMWDNTKMLGFYSVTSGMEIHIIDTGTLSCTFSYISTIATLFEYTSLLKSIDLVLMCYF